MARIVFKPLRTASTVKNSTDLLNTLSVGEMAINDKNGQLFYKRNSLYGGEATNKVIDLMQDFRNGYVLGNSDWRHLISWLSGGGTGHSDADIAYDATLQGITIANDKYVVIDLPISISPTSLYSIRIRYRRIAGDGGVFIGSCNEDESYNTVNSDFSGNTYNWVRSYTNLTELPVGITKDDTFIVGGYNTIFYVTAAPTSFVGIAAGHIVLNGISIGAVTAGTTVATQAANIANAVNLLSGSHGITATVILGSLLKFTSITGKVPLTFTLTGTATLASTGITPGLGYGYNSAYHDDKFDPDTKYFKVALHVNSGCTNAASKMFIESIEVDSVLNSYADVLGNSSMVTSTVHTNVAGVISSKYKLGIAAGYISSGNILIDSPDNALRNFVNPRDQGIAIFDVHYTWCPNLNNPTIRNTMYGELCLYSYVAAGVVNWACAFKELVNTQDYAGAALVNAAKTTFVFNFTTTKNGVTEAATVLATDTAYKYLQLSVNNAALAGTDVTKNLDQGNCALLRLTRRV